MKVPRLGVKSELQLLPYATATATQDPSRICILHQSLWQCQVLNPLIDARERTHLLMYTSRILNPLSHNRNFLCCWVFCFLGFFFIFFRAAPVAHGSSLARGRVGAVAAGLHHSHAGSEPCLRPTPQLSATPDP